MFLQKSGLIFYLLLFSPDQRLYTVHVVACVWCTLAVARAQDLSLSRWGPELSGWNWERTDMCSVQVYKALQAVTHWHWSGQHGDTGRVTLVASVTSWSSDQETIKEWDEGHPDITGEKLVHNQPQYLNMHCACEWQKRVLRAYLAHLWCDVDWSEKCRVACSKQHVHAPPSSSQALLHPWNKINPCQASGLDHGLLSGICTWVPHYFLCTDLAWPQSIMIYVSNQHSTRNSFLT